MYAEYRTYCVKGALCYNPTGSERPDHIAVYDYQHIILSRNSVHNS